MRQRLQRQPVAERRIAGDQKQSFAPRAPDFAQPSGLALRGPALQRQDETHRRPGMVIKQTQDARALVRVVDLEIARIDVVRDQT